MALIIIKKSQWEYRHRRNWKLLLVCGSECGRENACLHRRRRRRRRCLLPVGCFNGNRNYLYKMLPDCTMGNGEIEGQVKEGSVGHLHVSPNNVFLREFNDYIIIIFCAINVWIIFTFFPFTPGAASSPSPFRWVVADWLCHWIHDILW